MATYVIHPNESGFIAKVRCNMNLTPKIYDFVLELFNRDVQCHGSDFNLVGRYLRAAINKQKFINKKNSNQLDPKLCIETTQNTLRFFVWYFGLDRNKQIELYNEYIFFRDDIFWPCLGEYYKLCHKNKVFTIKDEGVVREIFGYIRKPLAPNVKIPNADGIGIEGHEPNSLLEAQLALKILKENDLAKTDHDFAVNIINEYIIQTCKLGSFEKLVNYKIEVRFIEEFNFICRLCTEVKIELSDAAFRSAMKLLTERCKCNSLNFQMGLCILVVYVWP
ncbi:hypothetical protein FACS189465_1310 [Clostridia bacterium]|nr:hypothetical protein FACS189465_1310 [Clostridia bacterium]